MSSGQSAFRNEADDVSNEEQPLLDGYVSPTMRRKIRASRRQTSSDTKEKVDADIKEEVDEGAHNLLFFASIATAEAQGRPASNPTASSPNEVVKARTSRDDSDPTLHHSRRFQIRKSSPRLHASGTSEPNTTRTTTFQTKTKSFVTIPAGTGIQRPFTVYRPPRVPMARTVYGFGEPTAPAQRSRRTQTVRVIKNNNRVSQVEVMTDRWGRVVSSLNTPLRRDRDETPSPTDIAYRIPAKRSRQPLGVRKSRHNTAGSKYPKLDSSLTQDKLDLMMNQNSQRHFMHCCAVDIARGRWRPEGTRRRRPKCGSTGFSGIWRLFFGFDYRGEGANGMGGESD